MLAVLALLASQNANAACVIHGVRPTVPLPTMAAGQEFSFLASADCETLRFRVPGTRFTKTPRPGSDTGPRPRTYKVALTESEWDSLVDDGDTTFRWSIIGTTSAGVTTRVTTTNDLKRDGGVTIDLSMADAKLVGERNDFAGVSVSGAGDVDGDGRDDLFVGAMGRDLDAGAACLVLGPVTGTVDLSRADATLVGEAANDLAGQSVSGAGDVNDDGHDDLLIGAWRNDEAGLGRGAAYVVLGPVTGTLDLSLADAKLVGEESGDWAGAVVSDGGDVNADGFADVLVGAYGNDEGGSGAGAAYLVLGPVTGSVDLSLANAKLVGEDGGDDAWIVAVAGDADGDGHDDLLVGARDAGSARLDAGAAYLVLGPVTGTIDLSIADAKLVGEAGDGVSGATGAGDVDGDGHDDLLIGAPDSGGSRGAAYLVLSPVTGTRNLSRADAKLVGEEREDSAGHVSDAGDVDADGHADILVGALFNNEGGMYAGAAYLVLGPVTGTRDLSRADAKLVGEEQGDIAGSSVSGAGDVDADGRADIVVGSYENEERPYSGAAYVVYGGGL